MGLYQRLTGPERAGEAAGTPPARKPVPDGRTVAVDEQVEIIGEINEILRKNRLAIRPETFKFTPRRRGATLPIASILP
jgi:hypothetical protein